MNGVIKWAAEGRIVRIGLLLRSPLDDHAVELQKSGGSGLKGVPLPLRGALGLRGRPAASRYASALSDCRSLQTAVHAQTPTHYDQQHEIQASLGRKKDDARGTPMALHTQGRPENGCGWGGSSYCSVAFPLEESSQQAPLSTKIVATGRMRLRVVRICHPWRREAAERSGLGGRGKALRSGEHRICLTSACARNASAATWVSPPGLNPSTDAYLLCATDVRPPRPSTS